MLQTYPTLNALRSKTAVKLFMLIVAVLFSTYAQSQITVSGTITNSSNKPTESANVMLMNTEQNNLYLFSITQSDGKYSIALNTSPQADSLLLVVMGFNIKKKILKISNKTQVVNISVEQEDIKIKEVIVNSYAITESNDTISYNVANFIAHNDRSIEDVLKKMPGITVDKVGKIMYNGKYLNKFYIEGLDLLKGRYALATKNISALDVAKIEIMKNHQPIKTLENIEYSPDPAMNIMLKDAAKGAWSNTVQLGAGYEPAMWNAELVAMYFNSKFQSINTYKTNNMGDDVSRELTSFYGGDWDIFSILKVQEPTTPPLSNNRYLNNNIHSAAINTINKLKEDVTLTVNANYLHDTQTSEGASNTTHYIANEAPVIIAEQTSLTQKLNEADIAITLENNSKKQYLTNATRVKASWNNDFGNAINNNSSISQTLQKPYIKASNNLRLIETISNKLKLNISSTNDYSSQQNSLSVSTTPFTNIFEPKETQSAYQTLNSSRFTSYNNIYTMYKHGKWLYFINANINANIENMTSNLTATNADGNNINSDAQYSNNTLWQRYDLALGPRATYKHSQVFSVSLNAPINYIYINNNDKIRSSIKTKSRILFSPSISIDGAIGHKLKYDASASFNEYYSGLYQSYGGYIMTNYRTISNRAGDIMLSQNQAYKASLSYSDIINALFATLQFSYNISARDLTYGYIYTNALTTIETYLFPNKSESYNVAAKISKRIKPLATTLTLTSQLTNSRNEIVQQQQLLNTQNNIVNSSLTLNSRLFKKLVLEYKAELTNSVSRIEGGSQLEPLNIAEQSVRFSVPIRKIFAFSLMGSHYYNETIESLQRNIYFADASLSYKNNRAEYSLEARNILNTKQFAASSTSDITNYVYSYSLRPRAIIFKAKFSLKR